MDRGRHVPEGLLIRFGRGALLAAIACGLASCGLFETRKATDPTNRFPCVSLSDPGNVFLNIRLAYGRGDGLGCYLSTLDDSFRFYPDPTDSTEAPPDFFKQWDKTVEDQVSQRLASQTTEIVVTYKGAYQSLYIDPNVAEIRRYTYEIAYAGSQVPDTLFQGIADITIRRSNTGFWLITDWVDRRDPAGTTSLTWGYLRYSHRTGF